MKLKTILPKDYPPIHILPESTRMSPKNRNPYLNALACLMKNAIATFSIKAFVQHFLPESTRMSHEKRNCNI